MSDDQKQPGVLAGIKVVDVGSFVAGPCAAPIMSDYGADVVKVEPLVGDGLRTGSRSHVIIMPGSSLGATSVAWRWILPRPKVVKLL